MMLSATTGSASRRLAESAEEPISADQTSDSTSEARLQMIHGVALIATDLRPIGVHIGLGQARRRCRSSVGSAARSLLSCNTETRSPGSGTLVLSQAPSGSSDKAQARAQQSRCADPPRCADSSGRADQGRVAIMSSVFKSCCASSAVGRSIGEPVEHDGDAVAKIGGRLVDAGGRFLLEGLLRGLVKISLAFALSPVA